RSRSPRAPERAAPARSRRQPCPRRRRARAPRLRGCARRERSASAGPDQTRGASRSGRTSARAVRTTRVRGASSRRPRTRARAYAWPVALDDDLESVAAAAAAFAAAGERVTGILATEHLRFGRIYLCAYAEGDERPTWLALDAVSAPV